MRILGLLLLAIMLLLSYGPSVWLVALSFLSERIDLAAANLSLDVYRQLFADQRWLAPLLDSTRLALLVAALVTPLALAVGRLAGRTSTGIRMLALALVPALVPGVVMGAALFVLLRGVLGLRPGEWSVLLGEAVWAFPFCTVFFFLHYRRFDPNWLDAAATLGLTPWQSFLKVELPILRPAIVSSLTFAFILAFTELPRSLFLRGATLTLPIFQWAEASSHTSQAAIIFGLSSLILLITSAAIILIILRQSAPERRA